jgi:hypothetical protein
MLQHPSISPFASHSRVNQGVSIISLESLVSHNTRVHFNRVAQSALVSTARQGSRPTIMNALQPPDL